MTVSPTDLYRRLLYVRRAEELIAKLYKGQQMRTPTHSSLGQEAIAVGVCAALNLPHDQVFASHRSHASYLACGGSFEALVAELYGRETGCSRGRGGSVHLTSREHGYVMSSAILAQSIPVAVGAALAFKLRGEPHVAVCFFGDAAMEEGGVYEAMNYASLMRLPVLFICEQNRMSTEAHFDKRFPAGTELCDRAVTFRVGAFHVNGNDVQEVYKATQNALAHARNGQPVFLECEVYRWLEHVGPNLDHETRDVPGRTREALEDAQANDPLKLLYDQLTEDGMPPQELAQMNTVMCAELEAAAERARAAPEPAKETLFEGVW